MVPLRKISRTRVASIGPRAYGFVLLLALLLSWPGSPATGSEPGASLHEAKGTNHPLYLRLETALQQHRGIVDSGGWPSVPDGPTIRPESLDPRLTALAKRLAASGDLEDADREFAAYNDDFQAAVIRFQSRHGLEPDALVGRQTLHALNVSADERLAQIRLNMDRVREAFDAERNDFVLVNVPAFEAHLVRNGSTVWMGKVVVGETETETPLFEATMTTVVLNPTWTVPRSIAIEDLLPRIKKDPGFLSRGGYELRDGDGGPVDPAGVDWAQLNSNNFPFTLVQRAGPLNELGRVKFLFPNDYGVCMHDTPRKHLFDMYSRAFSHGCIRLGAPVDFAAALLDKEGWTREQIDARLDSARTQTIQLANPLPIIVTYLTAMVDEAGTVYFYRDIYGKDSVQLERYRARQAK